MTIPAGVRAAIYWANTLAVVALGTYAVIVQASTGDTPGWIDGAVQILGVLAGVAGVTAATNINGDAIDPTALPPKARKILNWISGVINALLAILPLLYQVIPGATPEWVTPAAAALVFIGGILSGVATSHVVVKTPPADPAQPEAPNAQRVNPAQGW
jgi:hypothetical protein